MTTPAGMPVAGAGAVSPNAPQQHVLDNRSAPCAIGLIRAARLMATLPPGSVLEIWSRDHFAPMEVPLWAERDGYAVEQLPKVGRWPRGHMVFRVTKSS